MRNHSPIFLKKSWQDDKEKGSVKNHDFPNPQVTCHEEKKNADKTDTKKVIHISL